ncbi:MAG: hypothetical protein GF400_02125, partial [Candidatus Eisenbacteria bacterium]|nr:hypothetical protein [Candidatus Eisenbacteria bacterium]
MRTLVISVLLTMVVAVAATAGEDDADEALIGLGDIPRTYSHYMSAEQASMCRANIATGGLASYFFNPAAVSEVEGIAGQATIRYNIKSRDYLPDGEEYLDASEDGLLFSQFVAVRTSGIFTLGFGYSNPSYRNLELTGKRMKDDELSSYQREFNGSLRFFELVAAARIGDRGQGGIGLAAGIVNLTEESRLRFGQTLSSARLDGLSASYALGFTFDVTERVTAAIGYRWSSEITVDGDYYESTMEGESTTQPVTSAGVRYRPTDALTFHVGFSREGWSKVKSTLSGYSEEEGGDDWNQFGESISNLALGGELDLAGGRFTLRAGYSQELGADIDNAIVPENSIGLGGSLSFKQYVGHLAVVREQYAEGG